ncbi:D-cysteine desulfhydrase [Sinomonas atrocyanea]|uniref:D-cysteine desulfhydrase n=1 Tax=Sinomonas atrocyanea TaxID=37927 RepID=A0A127A1N7_9MICC|nr:D-cysteine desulfhydrase [Sinomonas atrocyanea]AMM31562.1 D-cysteine desulfhydrase [Sinomonas atrocyanea]GEB66344.1 D-cysteine desulfhydrase [Sinomonas atrocyanea]GGG70182.1 D-cysteine desulfhydrase [Sinomonas atrocyanea]
MQLARIPRRRYTSAPTPLEFLPRLSEHLGGPRVYVKRDDLLGLASGGNKTRKLEFLMADALAQGADTIITTGAVQSNHARLTLAAAVKEGLKCRLLLEERVPGSYKPEASGNNLLFRLLGAEQIRVVPGGTDLMQAMQEMADQAGSEGRVPYIIPGGGSNALGALGYISCAEEVLEQSFEKSLPIDHVICASGSGGTHAGLVAGFYGSHSGVPVTGISVRAEKVDQEEKLHVLANATSKLAGAEHEVPRGMITVRDDFVGPGYSLPTAEMTAAIQTFARLEGILLDPVYTGKAAAGLIGLIQEGVFEPQDNVLFVHTGGSPALYAYPDEVLAGDHA